MKYLQYWRDIWASIGRDGLNSNIYMHLKFSSCWGGILYISMWLYWIIEYSQIYTLAQTVLHPCCGSQPNSENSGVKLNIQSIKQANKNIWVGTCLQMNILTHCGSKQFFSINEMCPFPFASVLLFAVDLSYLC